MTTSILYQDGNEERYHTIPSPVSGSNPCYGRCKNCPLFPFKELETSGIYKSEVFRSFIVCGEQRKISSHGYRLLCALTRQVDVILAKEYLIEYVWPESTIVRNNLNVAIYDLRIMLRNSPLRIENIRNKGYRLTLNEE